MTNITSAHAKGFPTALDCVGTDRDGRFCICIFSDGSAEKIRLRSACAGESELFKKLPEEDRQFILEHAGRDTRTDEVFRALTAKEVGHA